MSPSSTGAAASASDAVVIPAEIESAISAYGVARHSQGYEADRGGWDDPAAPEKALQALRKAIAAALAPPTVPQSVRRLSDDEVKQIAREGMVSLVPRSLAAQMRSGALDDGVMVSYAIQGAMLLRDAVFANVPSGRAGTLPATQPPNGPEGTAERQHCAGVELQEIADGAYGDNPMVRGAARDLLAGNETWRKAPGSSTPNSEQRPGQACIRPQTQRNREHDASQGDSRKDGTQPPDGPEVSAPPGGGGVVEADKGARRLWSAYQMARYGGAAPDDLWESRDEETKAIWRSVYRVSLLAAAPATPEPATGGERENPTLLARLERERARLFEPGKKSLGTEDGYRFGDGGICTITLTNAEARSILSAPAGAQTAGGERETVPATTSECVELAGAIRREFGKLADAHGDAADDIGLTCDRVVTDVLKFLSVRALPGLIYAPAGAQTAGGEGLPNIGTPVQAIEFALKIDDHYDMREFLSSWNEGDISVWPEFLEAIAPAPPSSTATAHDAPEGGR